MLKDENDPILKYSAKDAAKEFKESNPEEDMYHNSLVTALKTIQSFAKSKKDVAMIHMMHFNKHNLERLEKDLIDRGFECEITNDLQLKVVISKPKKDEK